MPALPPLIHDKSRMRRRACTDLCGGRSAMVVPTATVIRGSSACSVRNDGGGAGSQITAGSVLRHFERSEESLFSFPQTRPASSRLLLLFPQTRRQDGGATKWRRDVGRSTVTQVQRGQISDWRSRIGQ